MAMTVAIEANAKLKAKATVGLRSVIRQATSWRTGHKPTGSTDTDVQKSRVQDSEPAEKTHCGFETIASSARTSVYSAAQALDPLVAAAEHNLNATLLSLPDDMLLDIMERLNYIDLLCLRWTSRVFMRMFGHPTFKRYHTPIYATPWPHMKAWGQLSPDERADTPTRMDRQVLFRDGQCKECYNFAVENNRRLRVEHRHHELVEKKLYCNGCKVDHPTALFSETQRGSTGTFDGTLHKWDKLHHICIAREGHLRVCQHRSLGWDEIEGFSDTAKSTNNFRIDLTLCADKSHLSTCSASQGTPFRPGIQLTVTKSFDGGLFLSINWDVHTTPFADPTHPRSLELRRALASLHDDAGQFLTPAIRHREPLHMACVDPNTCSCLHYDGLEAVDWQMRPADPDKVCGLAGGLWHSSHRVAYAAKIGRFTSEESSADLRPCGRAPACGGVVVGHRREFVLAAGSLAMARMKGPRCAAPEWYRLVDPSSYGLEKDIATRNLLWCDDKGCKSFSRWGQDRFRFVTV